MLWKQDKGETNEDNGTEEVKISAKHRRYMTTKIKQEIRNKLKQVFTETLQNR